MPGSLIGARGMKKTPAGKWLARLLRHLQRQAALAGAPGSRESDQTDVLAQEEFLRRHDFRDASNQLRAGQRHSLRTKHEGPVGSVADAIAKVRQVLGQVSRGLVAVLRLFGQAAVDDADQLGRNRGIEGANRGRLFVNDCCHGLSRTRPPKARRAVAISYRMTPNEN